MAHKEQREFCERVRQKFPEHFRNKKVLDIGSLDVNGNARYLFDNCSYIGLDLGEGKNIDVVCVGHIYDAPDEYFDTIISTETFEHDMFYEKTISNVIRMLKPGGLFLFTCAAPGRPEHGTRRCGVNLLNNQYDAPLLLQQSEEWSDYYKNLTEDDIRKSPSFNDNFPDGYFEVNNNAEIPSDLYFYGIKGGSKYIVEPVISEYSDEEFKDDIFVIDCWTDSKSKENNLINLIKSLKVFKSTILLTGHYPVKPEIQKMVDYYLFDKNNPLLVKNEFNEYGVNSVRWTEMGDVRVENIPEFHHDYAIWEAMRNAFNFCKYLGKKYIHFLEYDNLPEHIQYRQAFVEYVRKFGAVLYEYDKNSSSVTNGNPYCATYIFSIRTDVVVKAIDLIKTKEEFFRNKPDRWQLEKNFLNSVRQITQDIYFCPYIPNNNELNLQTAWNKDGVDRNGADIQLYLAVDELDDIYLHIISGERAKKNNENYLIEIVYRNYKKFNTVKSGDFLTYNLGKYQKGYTVRVYFEGIEIFSQFLGTDVDRFRESNKLIVKSIPKQLIKIQKVTTMVPPEELKINFIDGAFVEIKDSKTKEYRVQFVNKKTNYIEYQTNLKSNCWAKCTKQYYIDWVIKIWGITDYFYKEYELDLKNKIVLIGFESKALGDTLAWMPYVEKFRIDKKCKIACSTFHNNLFRNQYPEISFVEPGSVMYNIYALYRVGVFIEHKFHENRQIGGDYNSDKHPSEPRTEPLTKVASDILGLEYIEIKPKLPVLTTGKKKMVTIGVHGTAQCKYWNNSNGWQEVVDFLNSKGYEVRLLSREEDGYMGNKNPTGVTKIDTPTIEDVLKAIQESVLFIGVSSGLAWLSWGANVPTILISGFTNADIEPSDGIRRVINENVCHGCWSTHTFNPGDWNWCPVHQGTDKQFECSKTITSEQVITEIKDAFGWISKKTRLEEIYMTHRNNSFLDINEHLPTLKRYAEECDHITEMGVRECVSTFALMMGNPKKLISYDIVPIENYNIDREDIKSIAKENGVDFEFIVGDTTKIKIEETDFLFIDTEHIYEQLKTELKLHGNKVRKYIGLHDTTTNEYIGSIKGHKGLWPAIEEFLDKNPHWKLHERFTNNNGLTILKRDNVL
jgi:autotransporter strand-loop-strand O-heptosyltransferase